MFELIGIIALSVILLGFGLTLLILTIKDYNEIKNEW